MSELTIRTTGRRRPRRMCSTSCSQHSRTDGHDGQRVDIVVDVWKLGDTVHADRPRRVGRRRDRRTCAGVERQTRRRDIIAVAPLAVAPSRHGQGIGSALMRDFLGRAEEAGWPMVLLLGNPAYYGRFGFEPTGPLGITYTPVGADSPSFQARRLSTRTTTRSGGRSSTAGRPERSRLGRVVRRRQRVEPQQTR